MEVLVLGPLAVTGENGPVTLPGGRVRELLLRLVIAGARALPVERIVADLWPDNEQRTTTSTVRTYVARLRSALPEDLVVTRVGGYALDLSRISLDADHFEDEVRLAQADLTTDPEGAVRTLRHALSRWRGDAFEEVADQPWAQATATRLEEARLSALELEAEAQLLAGDPPGELAARLAELTREHPLRERLWIHRMTALYRAGRQADALACYQELRTLLDEELGLEPSGELRELERAILAQDPTLDGPQPDRADDPTPHTPIDPVPDHSGTAVSVGLDTTLVGRATERAEIVELLQRHPVVTVTGPAGVGKSRLAAAVVDDIGDRRTPTVTVQLAPVQHRNEIEDAIALGLGVARRGTLTLHELVRDRLDQSDALLVLDNCEHLADAVGALVRDLVARAPDLRVLATSRVPLGVPGERSFALGPLAVPPADASDDEARQADAVQLFQDRARAVSPDFELTTHTLRTVARICQRLDGLPFAIELAAARMRVMTASDVELRLNERFALLTGADPDARHETLREAIGWSYELLSETERRAFREFAVFVNPFDLPAAAAVADADLEHEIIDVVARLIDGSLLAVQRSGETIRYQMLETVRAFGTERLAEHGETVATRTRHAQYMASLAVHAGRLLHGPREAEGHAMLVRSRDDLRAAFDWSVLTGRWGDAGAMVTSVPWERIGRSLQWDLASWARRLVEEGAVLDTRTEALVRGVAAIGYWLTGDADAALRCGDVALELASRCDDHAYIETALAVAWTRWEAGDVEGAAALYVPLADPSLGEKVPSDVAAYCLGGIAMGMVESGAVASDAGARAIADELLDAAASHAEQSRCPASLAMVHLARGYRMFDDDPAAARAELERVAEVEGLALPSWSLHARAHLARYRAAAGELEGLDEELAAILRSALDGVDDMHLRLIGGFVGGALAVAGDVDRVPTLRPLVLEAFGVSRHEAWRRAVAEQVGDGGERAGAPSLTGLELEHAIRDAIAALAD